MVRRRLIAQKGPQEAIGGVRASIHVKPSAGPEADAVILSRTRFKVAVFCTDPAANAQASFRTGDIEEAGSVGRADADILDLV